MTATPGGRPDEPGATSDGEPTPTIAVLWAHTDPHWADDELEAWEKTVLSFAHLLRACGFDAELDLFAGVASSPAPGAPATSKTTPSDALIKTLRLGKKVFPATVALGRAP